MKKGRLAARFAFFIVSATTVIFAGILGYNYYAVKRTLIARAQADMKNVARGTIYRIEATLNAVEKIPLNLAAIVGKRDYAPPELTEMVRDAVANNAEIFGSSIAFAPYAFDPAQKYFMPYAYRSGGQLRDKLLGGADYDYFTMDWYQLPEVLKRSVWSEPYFDRSGGDILMATFSSPAFRSNGETAAIVTADVALEWLRAVVGAARIYENGYAFLLSANGAFLTAPQTASGQGADDGGRLIMRESIFSLAEARGDMHLRRIGQQMVRGADGHAQLQDFITGRPAFLYYEPLPSSGWSLGVVFPEDEIFADVRRLSLRLMVIGIIGTVLLTAVVIAISGSVTRPLTVLAARTADIAEGRLEIDLPPVKSADEIGELAHSFDEMRLALKEYIANLAQATAARERIESELKIASTIQASFLPKRFPPFREKEGLEIFARLLPARQVGGDLYDFFLVGEHRLYFAIGDVSGKGIPAALFMAVTKTLLKGSAQQGPDPAEVLMRVNRELCSDNESMMFATVFCGSLDLKSGAITYANAGHNPPLLLRRGAEPQALPFAVSGPLGCFDDMVYTNQTLDLLPGDALLLYTDGVTEATDHEERLYSEERLYELARAVGPAEPEWVVDRVVASVNEFCAGAEQSDDITLLMVRYRGTGAR